MLDMLDTKVPGLSLRVMPSGVRSWSFRYRRPQRGTKARLTLGRYPAVSVDDARSLAADAAALVQLGRDPNPPKAAPEVPAEGTFGELADRYLRLEAEPRNLADLRLIRSALKRHILPKWGERPTESIARRDVHDLLDSIAAQGKIGAAREVWKHTSRIFEWGLDREYVQANPCHRLRRRDLAPNKNAGRALTDCEMAILWAAAGTWDYPWGPYFRLLMLSGCRRTELAVTRWDEVDRKRQLLAIPAERQKSGRDHLIPLVGPAWEIVEALPRGPGRDYLFADQTGAKPFASFPRLKERAEKALVAALGHEPPRWRIHDLRVSFRSRMPEIGVSEEVAEALISHGRRGLIGIYNKFRYENEKRAALAAYGEHLVGLLAEHNADVLEG